jgi:hypothetical protein
MVSVDLVGKVLNLIFKSSIFNDWKFVDICQFDVFKHVRLTLNNAVVLEKTSLLTVSA